MKELDIFLSFITTLTTVVTCIYVIKAFKRDHERRSKQATIEMFRSFKEATKDLESEIFLKFGDIQVLTNQLDDEMWIKIKSYLSAIESFSAGVNLNVYDIIVANRLSGAFFIRKFRQFTPFIIEYRREKLDDSLYEEFEKMAIDLEIMRNNYEKHRSGTMRIK